MFENKAAGDKIRSLFLLESVNLENINFFYVIF